MFDENKHPRDDGGKFTEVGKTYRQNTSYADILENNDSEKIGQIYNSDLSVSSQDINQPSLDETLGQEYKGYKGQAAIDKLLQEKQGHVKAAFHRDDIGDIDLLWGNDYLGLQHIINHREAQGINSQDFLKNLAEVVENGNFRKKNDRGNFEFLHNGRIAVISPELRGNKITFLLTAFKTHSKK